MMWPTLGLRTAKEQNRTVFVTMTTNFVSFIHRTDLLDTGG